MKKCIILLLVFSSIHVIAQERKLIVGVKLLPEITLKFGDAYDTHPSDTEERVFGFNHFTMGAGTQVVVPLSKTLSLETGLYLHRQKYSYDRYLRFAQSVYGKYHIETTFNFIHTPLALRAELGPVYATFGGSLNYQATTSHETDGDPIDGNHDDGSMAFGLIATIGKDWSITKQFSIITEVRANGIPGYGAGMNVGLGVGANYSF